MEISNDILVSVCCITYNQVFYIRQCLDGFLMQKTNFKFEVIIHDDCSTDGTTDVIREYVEKYPDLIKPIFQEKNQYQNGCKRILATFVFPKAQGKYLALCEGDDYWIDPMKLQKQVDFLESHPDFGLCYTNYCKLLNGKLLKSKTLSCGKCDFNSLLFHNDIATLTVMCRKDILIDYDNNFPSSKWLMGDYPRWLYISTKMRVHYLDLVTSVYRVLPESASHSTNMDKQLAFLKSTYDIRRYFANHYLSELEKSNVLSAFDSNEMWGNFRIMLVHNKKDAYKYLLGNRRKMTFQMYLKALLFLFYF